MASNRTGLDLQGLFGALLGGIISSFIGLTAVTVTSLDMSEYWMTVGPTIVVAFGMVCAIGLMVAGLKSEKRFAWLQSTLFFASGFTFMWSAVMSLSLPEKWMGLLALAIAIAVGVYFGAKRFGGRQAEPADAPVADASVETTAP